MTWKRYVVNQQHGYFYNEIPWFQYLTAFTATLLTFTMGTSYGWPGPALVHLSERNSTIRPSEFEKSIIISIQGLTATFSPIISGIIVDIIGRKTTLLLISIPFILSWTFIYFATATYMLYAGRIFSGMGAGMALNVLPMYLGEISLPAVRGILANGIMLQCSLGILTAFAVGPFVSIKIGAIIFGCIPVVFLLTFIWMPESPYFHMTKGDEKKAMDVLRQLRVKNTDINDEIGQLKRSIDDPKNNKGTLRELLTIPSNRRAFIIGLGLLFGQQFTGTTAITAYAPTIFTRLNVTFISNDICGIVFAGMYLIATIISGILVDLMGRKFLLILSSFLTAISLFLLGLYFFMCSLHYEITDYSPIPAIALILFPLVYGVGLNSIPFIYIGELFPINVKALACFIIITYSSILMVLAVEVFHFVEVTFGLEYVFWIFMTAAMLTGLFVTIYVPETKGKSLEEIQKNLHSSEKTQNIKL